MKSTFRVRIAMAAAVALAAPAARAGDRETAGSTAEGTGAGSMSETAAGPGSTAKGGARARAGKAPSTELQEGLQKLHAANQAEIQGGKLARRVAASSDVKSYGETMVRDHTQADRQLATMAKAMGVNLMGKAFAEKQQDAQEMMGKVQGKTGVSFDRAYTELMVTDHEKDTEEVKDLAEDAREDGHAELAAFLERTAQVMDGHLSMARELEQKMKDQKSAASGDSAGDRESSTGSGGTTMP